MSEPIPYPAPPLVGTAFALRPFREDDFDAARELGQDAAAAPWVPDLPGTTGRAVAEFYEDCRQDGSLLHLVIGDRTTDRYLGETMLALSEHRVGEVGCCVIPAAREQRIGTDAVRLLADWSFARLGLGRVQAFVATENLAALRLAESAGFLREGVLRSYWEHGRERIDVVVLGRVPSV